MAAPRDLDCQRGLIRDRPGVQLLQRFEALFELQCDERVEQALRTDDQRSDEPPVRTYLSRRPELTARERGERAKSRRDVIRNLEPVRKQTAVELRYRDDLLGRVVADGPSPLAESSPHPVVERPRVATGRAKHERAIVTDLWRGALICGRIRHGMSLQPREDSRLAEREKKRTGAIFPHTQEVPLGARDGRFSNDGISMGYTAGSTTIPEKPLKPIAHGDDSLSEQACACETPLRVVCVAVAGRFSGVKRRSLRIAVEHRG